MTRQRVAMVCVLAAVLAAGPALAQPDFSTTTIAVSSESPLEADVVTFTVTLRNTGNTDVGSAYLSVEWPLMGFFVDATGFDGAVPDHDRRTIESSAPLPAGGQRQFAVRVLAPRDSGGDALTLAIHAADYHTMTEWWDRRTITIDTRPASTGIDVGGYRVLPAGLATAGVLACGLVLWLLVRAFAVSGSRAAAPAGTFGRLVGPGAAAWAVTIAAGFWLMFGVMAWRDYQSLTAWPQTTCTVVGRRLNAVSTTRSGSSSSGQPRRDDTNYAPVLGLRYTVDGRETFSSGYDTGSSLGIGGRGGRQRELDAWTVGSAIPCWYDPADPLDVVVKRGFGGAYLFALVAGAGLPDRVLADPLARLAQGLTTTCAPCAIPALRYSEAGSKMDIMRRPWRACCRARTTTEASWPSMMSTDS